MLAINDNAANRQRRTGPTRTPRRSRSRDARRRGSPAGHGPGRRTRRLVRYFRRVRVYGERLRCLHRTGTGGRWRPWKAAGERRRSTGSGASCPAGTSARPDRCPGALTRPWRREQTAVQPSRLVPRPDRPARAGCPGAARMPRPRRGDRSAAPRRLRRLARRGARARSRADAPRGRRLSAMLPARRGQPRP